MTSLVGPKAELVALVGLIPMEPASGLPQPSAERAASSTAERCSMPATPESNLPFLPRSPQSLPKKAHCFTQHYSLGNPFRLM